MRRLGFFLTTSLFSAALAATPLSLNNDKAADKKQIQDANHPPASGSADTIRDDAGNKRKKVLDLVRRGVVIIDVKNFASTESDKNTMGSGTGFIVDKEMGLIATNRHVAGDMTVSTYTVKFSNGTRVPANLVYFDPLYDFAFMKVDPHKLPDDSVALDLSKSRVQVNEGIYCMGNSGRDEFSTYRGTVFSIYENLGPFAEQSFNFSGLTIPGASGSPVFDEDGRVIGIVYGGKFSSGSALPISYVVDALKVLREKKMPEHRSLGIVPQYANLEDIVKAGLLPVEAMQKYLSEFPQANNKILIINNRISGTEARNVFKPGDLVWSVNKKLIGPNLYDLDVIVNEAGDKEVSVEVFRDGKLVEIKLRSYVLTLDYAWNLVTFMDGTWVSTNEFIKLFTGHKEEGVFLLGVGQTSPLKDLNGGQLMKVTEIDGQPMKNLQDLIRIIPTLTSKREIKVKYIDFLGMVGLGAFSPSDREERVAVVIYESKFDSPKFYKFDQNTSEWTPTDIVIKMGRPGSMTPTNMKSGVTITPAVQKPAKGAEDKVAAAEKDKKPGESTAVDDKEKKEKTEEIKLTVEKKLEVENKADSKADADKKGIAEKDSKEKESKDKDSKKSSADAPSDKSSDKSNKMEGKKLSEAISFSKGTPLKDQLKTAN